VAADGVTCNAVLPGSVRTRTAELKVAEEAELAGTTIEAAWEARVARTTAGRLVSADEVAATIVFLAGDAASAINGQAIRRHALEPTSTEARECRSRGAGGRV